MRKLIGAIGTLAMIAGAYQSSLYVRDYNVITQYGKGYVWGSVVLFLSGLGMVTFALKRPRIR
ncbi:MAG: hypothetical protein ACKOAG_05730 [Candidatus Kapaibacterium sp.]